MLWSTNALLLRVVPGLHMFGYEPDAFSAFAPLTAQNACTHYRLAQDRSLLWIPVRLRDIHQTGLKAKNEPANNGFHSARYGVSLLPQYSLISPSSSVAGPRCRPPHRCIGIEYRSKLARRYRDISCRFPIPLVVSAIDYGSLPSTALASGVSLSGPTLPSGSM